MTTAQPASADNSQRTTVIVPGFIALLTALSALGQFATSVYLPSLPAIRDDLGAPMSTVQLTLTVFLLAFALTQLLYGPLSDRFGRRRVLFTGLALYVLASALCVVAVSIEQLIIGRTLQAAGACAGLVVARAVVRDVYDGAVLARVMSYITIAFAVVPGFAPLLGGILQDTVGWRSTFVVATAAGLIISLIAWRWLPETNNQRMTSLHMRAFFGAYRPVLASPVFRAYVAATSLTLAALFAFYAGSPEVFIEHLGIPASLYGLIPAATVLGFLGGALLGARMAEQRGARQAVRAGLVIAALGAAAMLIPTLFGVLNLWALTAPMFVFVWGLGLVMPTGLATAISGFPERAGTASAMAGFLQMGGAALGTMVSAALYPLGPMAFPLGMTLLASLGLMAFMWMGRRLPPAY